MYFSDECACRQIHSGLFGKRLKKQSNRFSIKCNPSVSSWHLPYILRCKTQGRRIILSCVTCLFFPPIARRYPVILRDTTGGGVSYFCSTIVFNPLALRALPLYSLTETQRERFKSGISCFGIRIDFILLALRVLSLSYLWWAEGEAEFYRKSIQLLFNHSPKRLECGCR